MAGVNVRCHIYLGDKIIFLPPPDKEARRFIFERQLGNVVAVNNKTDDEMSWDSDFSILVELSEGMTGAEIVGACQEAKIHWMRETFLSDDSTSDDPASDNPATGGSIIENEFFQQDYIVNALMSIKPLLSNPEALKEFQIFENRDKKSFHR